MVPGSARRIFVKRLLPWRPGALSSIETMQTGRGASTCRSLLDTTTRKMSRTAQLAQFKRRWQQRAAHHQAAGAGTASPSQRRKTLWPLRGCARHAEHTRTPTRRQDPPPCPPFLAERTNAFLWARSLRGPVITYSVCKHSPYLLTICAYGQFFSSAVSRVITFGAKTFQDA